MLRDLLLFFDGWVEGFRVPVLRDYCSEFRSILCVEMDDKNMITDIVDREEKYRSHAKCDAVICNGQTDGRTA